MQDIISFLKEEFDFKNGISLDVDKTLEVIRALEKTAEIHKAWVEQYREIKRLQNREYELETRITELEKKPIIGAMSIIQRAMDSQDARIKHLESIIERTKNEANLYYGTGDLLDILNEA